MTDLAAPHPSAPSLPRGVVVVGLAAASWIVLVGAVWLAINGLLLV